MTETPLSPSPKVANKAANEAASPAANQALGTAPQEIPSKKQRSSPSVSLQSNQPGQAPKLSPGEPPIVFFDGECVLCNGFLNVMFAIDHKQTLRVAPLQGSTAQELLPPLPHDPEDWSIYYLDEHGLYYQSEAVLQILRQLGGIWSLLSLGRVIPTPLRDWAYRLVANNRYQLLGKRENCRVPTKAEAKRFLP